MEDLNVPEDLNKWGWECLTNNPAITIEDILQYYHLPWKWSYLHENPNASFQTVLDHPQIPWDWTGVSSMESITLSDYLAHRGLRWCWDLLQKNMKISMQEVLDHPELRWDIDYLIENPNITATDIMNNLGRMIGRTEVGLAHIRGVGEEDKDVILQSNWDIAAIDNISRGGLSSCVTLEDISKHPDVCWRYRNLSDNPNITLEYVSNHTDTIDNKWDWILLSTNRNITWNDVIEHPELPWDWKFVSWNPNVTLRNVLNHSDLPWNWNILSQRPWSKPNALDPEIQKEIHSAWIEMQMRPGNAGYLEAQSDFKQLSALIVNEQEETS